MNKGFIQVIIIGLVISLAAAGFIFYVLPGLISTDSEEAQEGPVLGYGSDAIQGEILEILEEGETQLGEVTQLYQVLKVKLLEGEYQDLEITVDYGKHQLRPEGLNLKPGDKVILTLRRGVDNLIQARFLDFVRTGPLLILFGTFVFFSVLISGWKGVRSLLGMVASLSVIIFYITPQILQGRDPVLITVSGAFFLLAVTLYLVYGWTLKTQSYTVSLQSGMIGSLLAEPRQLTPANRPLSGQLPPLHIPGLVNIQSVLQILRTRETSARLLQHKQEPGYSPWQQRDPALLSSPGCKVP